MQKGLRFTCMGMLNIGGRMIEAKNPQKQPLNSIADGCFERDSGTPM